MKAIPIFLLAVMMLALVVAPVMASYDVVYDDGVAGWFGTWQASISLESSGQYYGASCVKITSTGAGNADYDLGSDIDWSGYTQLNLYLKGSSAMNIDIHVLTKAHDYNNYFTYPNVAITTDWALISIPFASFGTGAGTPSWAESHALSIYAVDNGQDAYVDYAFLSSQDVYLTMVDPIYATLSPSVGIHGYPQGQPINVSATPINNYSFVKFSFYPVSDSTYNPVWLIMSQNITASTILEAPTPTDYIAPILPMVIIFFLFGASVFFFLANFERKIYIFLIVIFALVINLFSLGSGIPFTPYVQLAFSVLELMMLIGSFRLR